MAQDETNGPARSDRSLTGSPRGWETKPAERESHRPPVDLGSNPPPSPFSARIAARRAAETGRQPE